MYDTSKHFGKGTMYCTCLHKGWHNANGVRGYLNTLNCCSDNNVSVHSMAECIVLMRDEKEERSKQGQTNNKAKQHSTPKAVTYVLRC